jgi:hypothetical protein
MDFARSGSDALYPELRNGLIGLWLPGLGFQGDKLIDYSNRGFDGSLVNMDIDTDWVLEKGQYALDFDGVNDHVVVADDALWNVGGALTCDCWFNIPSANSNTGIALPVHDLSNYKYLMYLTGGANTYSQFYIRTSSGVKWADGSSINTLNNGNWRHIAGTFDKTLATARIKLYVDGTLLASDNGHGLDISSGDEGLHLASQYNSTSTGLKGLFCKISVYNRALGPSEISLLAKDVFAPVRKRQVTPGLFPVAGSILPVAMHQYRRRRVAV